MQKKIFFLLNAMNVGGVEKAFLGLLSIIPIEKYEIHVGFLQAKGGYMKYLPSYICIHEINIFKKYWRIINDPPIPYIKSLFKQGKIIDALVHSIIHFYFKLTGNRYWFYKYMLRNEPIMIENFDIAIAFAGPSQAIDYYICEKINAPIKCGWIHFDVTKFGIDKGMTRRLYQQYQKIFIVSQTAKEKFDSIFPELKNKTEVFYNIISKEQVKKLAIKGSTFTDNFQGVRILTVGRLSEEKGQNVAIQALKLLLDNGYNVRWYFVGEGKLMDTCKQLAEKLQISNSAVFLGLQTNPYGFMRDCDIYVQPSRHEGFCITLAEALCFNNPIVATNFTGAKEQLKLHSNCIVSNMSAEDIAIALQSIIKIEL